MKTTRNTAHLDRLAREIAAMRKALSQPCTLDDLTALNERAQQTSLSLDGVLARQRRTLRQLDGEVTR